MVRDCLMTLSGFTGDLVLRLSVCISMLFIPMIATSQPPDMREAIISVERIWDRAGHNAFTDILSFRGTLYCCFREGTGHVPGLNGTIRVIASDDGQNWRSVAHMALGGVDLRDPKLSVAPDGRIMALMGGSVYDGNQRVSMAPRVAFSNTGGTEFSRPQPIFIDKRIRSDHDWLWRVTWHQGTGYGVIYQPRVEPQAVQLVATIDGIGYSYVTTFRLDGRPNETTLRFLPDDTMIALVRREEGDQRGMIGTSVPPYKEWTWAKLFRRLGGPNFIRLPDGSLLCGTRDYRQEDAYSTLLGFIDIRGQFEDLFRLPSGGDTSYPGFASHNGTLYVSYYSSHEGKSAIYLAKLRLAAFY